MANLSKGKLISKLGYIAYFNEKVWQTIASTAGNKIYHGGASDVTLNKDVITKTTQNAEGKTTKTGTTKIKIYARPTFSSTGYVGANTTSGSATFKNMPVMPVESVAVNGTSQKIAYHLKSLSANTKQYFTITEEDLDAMAVSMGYDPNLAVADVLYAACFQVIGHLICIRPFTASWTHDSSEKSKRINEKFNNGGYSYAVFDDTRSAENKSAWKQTSGSGKWDAGNKLSKWNVTLGGNIKNLKITEAQVVRSGVYKDNIASASKTTTMVGHFWSAWSDRQVAKNKFNYEFYSCHLNCHSSCHNSCHGSRSRR